MVPTSGVTSVTTLHYLIQNVYKATKETDWSPKVKQAPKLFQIL